MTKEELKKEAIKYAVDYPTSYGKGYKHKDLRIAYLAGAEPREKRIAELEEKLKYAEENCINKTCVVFKDKEDCVAKLLELEKEYEGYIAELKLENQKWKDEWQEQVQKATDEGYARTLQTIQLTKAKEILKAVVDFYPTMTATILLEAEQFLNSEVEK